MPASPPASPACRVPASAACQPARLPADLPAGQRCRLASLSHLVTLVTCLAACQPPVCPPVGGSCIVINLPCSPCPRQPGVTALDVINRVLDEDEKVPNRRQVRCRRYYRLPAARPGWSMVGGSARAGWIASAPEVCNPATCNLKQSLIPAGGPGAAAGGAQGCRKYSARAPAH